jgi:hypothetical protein
MRTRREIRQTSDCLAGKISNRISGRKEGATRGIRRLLDALFERGEVDFSMNYNVSHASNKIATGQYPDTVRTFVPEDSALFNLHFTAVPFNSPNKAGALVLSNYLLSPEIQLSKNDPANWGDLTVLDPGETRCRRCGGLLRLGPGRGDTIPGSSDIRSGS